MAPPIKAYGTGGGTPGSFARALDLVLEDLSALDVKAAGDGPLTHDGLSMFLANTANCTSSVLGGGQPWTTVIPNTVNGPAPSLGIRIDDQIPNFIAAVTRVRAGFRMASGQALGANTDVVRFRFSDDGAVDGAGNRGLYVQHVRNAVNVYAVDGLLWNGTTYASYTNGSTAASLPRWLIGDLCGIGVDGYSATTEEWPASSDLSRRVGEGTFNANLPFLQTSNERWLYIWPDSHSVNQTLTVERIVVEYAS
jgi:hypothetical protein